MARLFPSGRPQAGEPVSRSTGIEVERYLDPPAAWQPFLSNCPDVDIAQTVPFADMKRALGADACWFVVRSGGCWAAAAQVLNEGAGWTMWKGPCGQRSTPELLAALLPALHELGGVRLVLALGWEYPTLLRAAGCEAATPFSTLVVRTSIDEEEVLTRCRPSVRGRVRRATRAGLEFSAGRRWLDGFYETYEPLMRGNRSPDLVPLTELDALLALDDAHLFVAVRGDRVAAGSVCYQHRRTLESRYVATDPALRWTGALNFVHVKTATWAAARGIEKLDLGGLAPEPGPVKTAQINRFKRGFGGKVVTYPVHLFR